MSDKNPKSPAEQRPPGEPKQSGRVAYDSKGNPVWEWEASTGVYDRNVSTQRLKKLEAKLSLEATQPVEKPKGLALQDAQRLPGGGMNPYDTGGPASGRVSQAAHPALVHKQAVRDKASGKSLVSKYAAKQKGTGTPPQGLWSRLKAHFKGDK